MNHPFCHSLIKTTTTIKHLFLNRSKHIYIYTHPGFPHHPLSNTSAMSWMDSWSRPSKSTQFPPPYYLTTPNIPYCKSCGRVISSRRNNQQVSGSNTNSTTTANLKSTSTTKTPEVKYCSERCRRTKPGKVDRQIEDAFVALLRGDKEGYLKRYSTSSIAENQVLDDENEIENGTKKDKERVKSSKIPKKKGDSRIIINCSEVETLVFGSRHDPLKTAGRRKNRLPRGVVETGEWRSVDMEDRPPPPPPSSSIHYSHPPTQVIANEDYSSEYSHSEESEESEADTGGGVDLSATPSSHHSKPSRLHFTNTENTLPDHIPFSAGRPRPSQSEAEVNGSIGGEKGWAEKVEETSEMFQKRREGQKRAEEREMVKRAARRGVVFGFLVADDDGTGDWNGGGGGAGGVNSNMKRGLKGKGKGKSKSGREGRGDVGLGGEEDEDGEGRAERRRKCEAVVTKAAVVVEPSFAKGDWGVRWREEVMQ